MSNLDNQLERIAGMISNLTAATEKNTQDISKLQTSIQNLVNIVTQQQGNQEQLQRNQEQLQRNQEQLERNQEQHQRNFDESMIVLRRQGVDIKEMQVEIRGLQTENRRILDGLINREEL